MSDYLILESESPFGAASEGCAMAAALAGAGHDVTLFLLQNAVFAARRAADTPAVLKARAAGASLLADDYSLRERGIAADQLRPEVAPSPLESVVDRLAGGAKVLWF